MSIDYQKLRIDGIYQQDKEGNLMLRVKVPAGVLSSEQAEKVCAIAERFSNGLLHLTSRGSIEIHWLKYDNLQQVMPMLASVGLTSRGACGGAVRGIACSTTFAEGFETAQTVARRLQRHFAGNPHFEGLPKKFKVGIDAGYRGARHLIQDIGLVHTGQKGGSECFDVWCAGGLGREPQAGFLLERDVPEGQVIPLIEAVVRVYARNTPAGKRLKHLLRDIGEEQFRSRLQKQREHGRQPQPQQSVSGALTAGGGQIVEAPIFAGELSAETLRRLAILARKDAGGFLALTADQDIALSLTPGRDAAETRKALEGIGLAGDAPEQKTTFRVCPGNHECKMGLSPTRDTARQLLAALGDKAGKLTLAISGCPNSCSQPQLAEVGIVTAKLTKGEDGSRSPRFDLYLRGGEGLGERIEADLDLGHLASALVRLHE